MLFSRLPRQHGHGFSVRITAMSFSASAILFASLIIFAAFFVRSLTGFGSALVSIPLLALFLDVKMVVPLEVLFEIGLSVLLIRSVYRQIRGRALVPLLIGAAVGTIVGVQLLSGVANITLKRALGVGIILFALQLLWQRDSGSPRDMPNAWGVAAGVTGGIFGGLFGTNGPPYVIYLTHKLREKEALRASLIGLIALDDIWRAGVYAFTGLYTREIITFAVFLIPALVLGTYVGHKTHLAISERRFRQLVAGILILSGLALLIR